MELTPEQEQNMSWLSEEDKEKYYKQIEWIRRGKAFSFEVLVGDVKLERAYYIYQFSFTKPKKLSNRHLSV